MGELIAEVVQENAKSTNSSVEGMAIACGSMMLMALLPIIIGAFRSVDVSPLKGQKVSYLNLFDLHCSWCAKF